MPRDRIFPTCRYSFEYDDNVDLEHLSPEERAELDKAATKNGWTTKDLTANLTRVRWTVKSPDTTETKTENITSQESRDVWIKGYTQTVVPPVNPGPDTPELPPVEDAKPAPAPAPAPETPVLPVVQDARPDPAPAPAPAPAPETPVLPAVQDAKLIQTGTSGWLADLMLGAGMVLSAAGYWMERKRKAMFYKSQH